MRSFNNIYPWSEIETVTIDGQQMVRIPKFYVKVTPNPEGAGRKCWWVSEMKAPGYHVHPAFMHEGHEIDQFYFSAYEASQDAAATTKAASLAGKSCWVNINFSSSQNACTARNLEGGEEERSGWHMQTYYERCAISLLCMIELGTPDAQGKINAGNTTTKAAVATGSSNAVWRGIHELWGNLWEWCDGYKTGADGRVLYVHDNKGKHQFINTGIVLPTTSNNGIMQVQDAKGDNFDMTDMFVVKTTTGSSVDSVFKDGTWIAAGAEHTLLCNGAYDIAASCGLNIQCLDTAPSATSARYTFRLAKW